MIRSKNSIRDKKIDATIGHRSRTQSTIINTVFGIIVKILTIVSNFIIRTVFIHYLGIEYTGISAVFSNILTVLSFAELGIGSAITYALYKPIKEQDNRQISKLMGLYKKAYYIIAIVVLSFGILFIPFLKTLITNVPTVKEDLTVIYILYIINTTVSYFLIYKITLLIANQQSYIESIVRICITVIRISLQLLIIIRFRNFIAYLITQIILTFIHNLICSYIADKQFPEIKQYKGEELSRGEKTHIFKDVKALALYKISGTILSGTDSIIISSMIGSAVVGYVSNYTMIISEIYNLLLQFLNSLTASLGNLVASKESHRQHDVFKKVFFLTNSVFCILTVCLFNLIDEFVCGIWLDDSFCIDRLTVFFLCLDFFIKGNATLINSYRNGNGLFVQGQYRPIIMAVINIFTSIICVEIMGLPGVFLGTVFSRMVTQVWYDPIIIYKYAFNTTARKYFALYFLWLLILFIHEVQKGCVT